LANKRVVDAEYNMETELGCLRGDPGHYDIVFYDGDRLSKAIVEADSGMLGPGHEESVLRRLFNLDFVSDWPMTETRKGAPAAAASPITLSMAVGIAQQQNQGMPLAAHISTGPAGTRYAVELVQRDGLRIVFVDFRGFQWQAPLPSIRLASAALQSLPCSRARRMAIRWRMSCWSKRSAGSATAADLSALSDQHEHTPGASRDAEQQTLFLAF
jgi:hypothetical protein